MVPFLLMVAGYGCFGINSHPLSPSRLAGLLLSSLDGDTDSSANIRERPSREKPLKSLLRFQWFTVYMSTFTFSIHPRSKGV